MKTLCTIGLDIAKNYFQVHGKNGYKKVVLKKLTHEKVVQFFKNIHQCIVDIEACGGTHYWAPEFYTKKLKNLV